MATTQVEEPQRILLAAALAFLEKSGIGGHSMLVALPGGLKLGIELELIGPTDAPMALEIAEEFEPERAATAA
jgi:hypothetical protein